ncbi:MAG: glutamate 5-kinase, partial [Candidatus Pacebacteria bacterium]|nr:glutamate 5-kinase [Candidatus Paceibacterota bacterium]
LLREQILASVGQPKLMGLYNEGFGKHGLSCAQLLTTRSDFADREFYLSLRIVTEELFRHGVVPIFNENDVLSPEELDFSDNDQLALMTAAMILADRLVLLTDVPGVYDRAPNEAGATLIPEIEDVGAFLDSFEAGKHKGKGGIQSKLLCAEVITSLGIPMHIASALEKAALSRILRGEKLGTFFPTANEREEAKKSWLITSAAGAGKIVVSTILEGKLRQGASQDKKDRKTPSILFAGIEKVSGEFNKGDVVEIVGDDNAVLGRGVSRFSSNELRTEVARYEALPNEKQARVRTAETIAVHANDFAFIKP